MGLDIVLYETVLSRVMFAHELDHIIVTCHFI